MHLDNTFNYFLVKNIEKWMINLLYFEVILILS